MQTHSTACMHADEHQGHVQQSTNVSIYNCKLRYACTQNHRHTKQLCAITDVHLEVLVWMLQLSSSYHEFPGHLVQPVRA